MKSKPPQRGVESEGDGGDLYWVTVYRSVLSTCSHPWVSLLCSDPGQEPIQLKNKHFFFPWVVFYLHEFSGLIHHVLHRQHAGIAGGAGCGQGSNGEWKGSRIAWNDVSSPDSKPTTTACPECSPVCQGWLIVCTEGARGINASLKNPSEILK